MDWALFCQIEVILLTIGLVIAFIISMLYNMKDNSFFKRVRALGVALSEFGKAALDKQHKDPKIEVLEDLVASIKKDKEKESKS